MNAQDIVNTVSSRLKLDPAVAEKAVGTIFSVLEHESGGVASAGIFTRIAGAGELAHSYDVMDGSDGSGGLVGSLSSLLGASFGEKAGAMVNGIAQLRSLASTCPRSSRPAKRCCSQPGVQPAPKPSADLSTQCRS